MAELIYQAGFGSAALEPIGGANLGPLHLTQAPGLPGSAADKMDLQSSPGKARFTITRPTTLANNQRDNCYVGAVVSPFPRLINYFKLRATFELPEWNSKAKAYGWAPAIFYRKGGVDYWPYRNERATVTLRSTVTNGTPVALLNMPGQSGQIPPVQIPDDLYAEIYASGVPERSTFTLEILVDRKRFGIARARLEAQSPSGPYVAWRWFKHDLITEDMTENPVIGPTYPDGSQPHERDSVGFAIAIASADQDATAAITVTDFSIYRLSLFEVLSAIGWFRAFGMWLLGPKR